jgi:hypothetical protein
MPDHSSPLSIVISAVSLCRGCFQGILIFLATSSRSIIIQNSMMLLPAMRDSFFIAKNKNLIKPQNYTENAEMFNLGVIIKRSFCPDDLITGLTVKF